MPKTLTSETEIKAAIEAQGGALPTPATEQKEPDWTPLHVIAIDGTTYHIRTDYYGRFQVYETLENGLERSVGRMRGYASLKECYDGLFVSRLQD